MRLTMLTALLLCCNSARAGPVYDFVIDCKAAPLWACFGRLETELDQIREREQNHAFCVPPIWNSFMPSTRYPVSVLDYMLLRLSAARFGRAGDPTDEVLRDILADMYPCRKTSQKP